MKEKTSINSVKKIGLMIYTFVVLYTPTFFSNVYINYALPFVYMIIGLIFLKNPENDKKIRGIFYYISILCGFWILAAMIFVVRALIAGVAINDLINLRIVQSISMIATIISVCKIEQQLSSWKLNLEDKMKFLLNVTMIQAFFVIIMLLLPSLRTILLQHFYQYGNGNEFTMAKRVYGIMSNYTFSGAIFHGFIASIALTFGIIYNKKFYLYVPFLILIVVLNGRTGMMIFLVGVAINILYFIVKNKYILKMCSSLIIISIIVTLSLGIIKSIKPDTYKFLMQGMEDILNYLVKDEVDGNVEVLLGNFNNNININTFLLGNGYKIQNSGDIPDGVEFEGEYSDMGYLNDMYMGGILYMILLYIPLICVIFYNNKKITFLKHEKIINDMISYVSILMVAFCNIKGEVFRASILIAGVIFLKTIVQDKKEWIKYEKESISDNVNL